MKRFIVGDIHARFDLLRGVLDKSGFNEDEDVLYSVGDLCDRGDKPVETLFFLMSLRDFRPVLGNHDAWLEEYLCTGIPDPSWTRKNGGDITCRAMRKLSRKSREMLRLWLRTFPIFRIENDLIIVHGGFPSEYTEKELIELSKVSRPSPLSAIYSEAYEDENLDWMEEMIWDRDYLFSATPESRRMPYWMPRHEIKPIDTDKTIFTGHTPTLLYNGGRPFISKTYHLVSLDTGAGSGRGPLTLMDIDSGKFYQSFPE